MPFVGTAETKLVLNPAAARAIGVATPGAIQAKADEVVGN
jgi:hypothetical protein